VYAIVQEMLYVAVKAIRFSYSLALVDKTTMELNTRKKNANTKSSARGCSLQRPVDRKSWQGSQKPIAWFSPTGYVTLKAKGIYTTETRRA
jgi:hypothetical protein